jgi:hypothetical protein
MLQFFTRRIHSSFCGQTILTLASWLLYSTVPTEEQILVPETLLKKRKSQEKAREERLAEQQKKKKVRVTFYSMNIQRENCTMVMTLLYLRLVPRINVVVLLTIFRD